eukprot:gene16516-7938_t
MLDNFTYGRQSRIGFGPSTCMTKSTFHRSRKEEGENESSQEWSDGSVYSGEYKDGHRHGHGEARWPNGEIYIGEFINDKKEGKGSYFWPDGSQFEGSFKADKRNGYGKLKLVSGNVFEGIYVDDVRHGPGILSYIEDDTQDVGLWINEKIYRICSYLPHSFTYKNFSRHSINASPEKGRIPQEGKAEKNRNNKKTIWKIDDEILLTLPKEFQYEDILNNRRSEFRPKGKLEIISEKFINCARKRDTLAIEQMLRSGDVHPDVTDATGFGAMMAASVNCHADVINCLLDYGANVNILNAEGLSPLAACHVLLYTYQDFVDNIAENIPKENTFNSTEWDKQRGCFIHRNDRKAILAMHGAFRSSSNELKGKNPSKASLHSAQGIIVNEKCPEVDTITDSFGAEDRKDQDNPQENWKLTYFKRTLSRGEELDMINRSFKELKARPFDFQNIYDDLDPVPLPALAAEQVAKEVGGENEAAKMSKDNISNESIYCGDSSFGHAPGIEAITGDAKEKLLNSERKPHLKSTIKLLLDRGADPNSSSVPMPVIFFAVKAADIKACEALLAKGADTSIKLDENRLCLAPLHIAVSLPCAEGVDITRLLLEANADPDIEDMAFKGSVGGRTPLHIVCTREDNDKDAQSVALYLLKHKANPNLLCHGHSPLSLAICSGNDFVVDVLLKHTANPNLKLGKAVGSALCAATTFTAERRRQPSDRVKVIDKLVKAGADLLAPIHILDKYPPGTVVDYAYHVFNQDRRIAHTPYHALSAHERACHNTRKELLEHFGYLLRTAALKRERSMLEAELLNINEAARVDENVATADLGKNISAKNPSTKKETSKKVSSENSGDRSPKRDPNCGLPFSIVKSNDAKTLAALETNAANQRRLEAKRRFRYCYECGRLLGVRLAACTRCKEVFYCSKNCKVKAWNMRHKEECARFSGRRSRNAADAEVAGTATPTTDAECTTLQPESPSRRISDQITEKSVKNGLAKTGHTLSVKRQGTASSKIASSKAHSAKTSSLKSSSHRIRSSIEVYNGSSHPKS